MTRSTGKSGSPRCNRARPSSTPWTIDEPTCPPLSLLPYERCLPRSPTSLALARGNFSFVHETAWSTAVYLMSLGSVVTRRRDAPILWTQMRHLRRTLSRQHPDRDTPRPIRRSRILRGPGLFNSRQRRSPREIAREIAPDASRSREACVRTQS